MLRNDKEFCEMSADKQPDRILMVGAGKMGGALIESWLIKKTINPGLVNS